MVPLPVGVVHLAHWGAAPPADAARDRDVVADPDRLDQPYLCDPTTQPRRAEGRGSARIRDGARSLIRLAT